MMHTCTHAHAHTHTHACTRVHTHTHLLDQLLFLPSWGLNLPHMTQTELLDFQDTLREIVFRVEPNWRWRWRKRRRRRRW